MTSLTLEVAQAISAEARRRARELGCQPLTIAVLDRGGYIRLLEREDGSGVLRQDIAIGKAWGAVGMGLPSRELARKGEGNPGFLTSLAAVSQGRLVPVPGGVLVLEEGRILGAVGIAGDTGDNDEACAIAGIESVGLVADNATDPTVRPLDI